MNIQINQNQCILFLDENSRYNDFETTEHLSIDSLEKIIIDFVNVYKANSYILNILVYLRKKFAKKIILQNMNYHVHNTIKTVGLLSYFDFEVTQSEAGQRLNNE